MKFWSGVIIAVALVATPACGRDAAAQPEYDARPDSAAAKAPPGVAIASAHALATEAGLEIIREGGNAFDAAIAVSAALSVVEPISSGIGGGGFFLLHQAEEDRDVFLDARETSPAAVSSDDYLTEDGEFDRDRATNGPWAAGIPGLPAAFVHLANEYGQLPLERSLAPAIRLADEGFPVYGRMERGYQSRAEVMERYPGTRDTFLIDGRAMREGDTFRQPDLARTLERLAADGFDGFYRGRTAELLLEGVQAEGGVWTADDLASYKVVEREPLRLNYHEWEIVTAPPPSSGGVALAQMLQILAGWELEELDPALRAHLTVESMRRAFRDRTFYLGDPDFVEIPMETLTSRDYAAGLRATIHPQRATPSDMLSGEPTPLEGDETTHFSIIDAEGNRVAATQTVNLLYGSGLVPPGTGVLLNNEMDDFALQPGEANAFGVMGFDANAPEPGKRMLSSMTPTFMLSDDRIAVLGTPGGTRIITMVLLGILGYDAGLDAQSVAALPRFHHQWLPDRISAERGAFSPEVIARLREMGHEVDAPDEEDEMRRSAGRTSSHSWGNLQTVAWNLRDNTLEGGTDPRNEVGSAEVQLTPEP